MRQRRGEIKQQRRRKSQRDRDEMIEDGERKIPRTSIDFSD